MKKLSIFLCMIIAISLTSCSDKKSETAPNTKAESELSCTIEILCDEALSSSLLSEDKRTYLPEDGMIIEKCEVGFEAGESAFDVLLREIKSRKIHFDFSETPAYNSKYIRGVSNLYEFDCGDSSGWLYFVNGESPDVGYNQYEVNDGDNISLIYTCDWTKFYKE